MSFHPELGRCWTAGPHLIALQYLPCAVTCLDVSGARFLLKLLFFFLRFPSPGQTIFIHVYTSGVICQFMSECFVIVSSQIQPFSIWDPPPPVNIDFELANFSFHLGSCAMRQGFDPKERGLGSVMDVVKPSVPKLGNGQRASRETL